MVPRNALNHSCPITHSHVIYMIKEPTTIDFLGAKNGIVPPGLDQGKGSELACRSHVLEAKFSYSPE